MNFNLDPGFLSSWSFNDDLAASVMILAGTLAIVSLFIFQFYKSLSKRNLISLNLYKYNTSDHPIESKVLAMLLYLVEYVLFIPFVIILWFAGFSVILFLLAKGGQGTEYILLVAAALVGAIRILAYIKTEIAADLAKLFPFVALSLIVLTPGEYTLDVILNNLNNIPSLLGHVLSFVFMIALVEVIMRIVYTVYEFWKSEEVGIPREETAIGILTGMNRGN